MFRFIQRVQWNLCFTMHRILAMMSLQIFTHATTTMLSHHMQTIVAIDSLAWLDIRWQENEIPLFILNNQDIVATYPLGHWVQWTHVQDCFLPKGSYAYPCSVIIFSWSEIYIEKFRCVWVNKTSEHTRWEKSTALKDCDQKEMIGFDCICL